MNEQFVTVFIQAWAVVFVLVMGWQLVRKLLP